MVVALVVVARAILADADTAAPLANAARDAFSELRATASHPLRPSANRVRRRVAAELVGVYVRTTLRVRVGTLNPACRAHRIATAALGEPGVTGAQFRAYNRWRIVEGDNTLVRPPSRASDVGGRPAAHSSSRRRATLSAGGVRADMHSRCSDGAEQPCLICVENSLRPHLDRRIRLMKADRARPRGQDRRQPPPPPPAIRSVYRTTLALRPWPPDRTPPPPEPYPMRCPARGA